MKNFLFSILLLNTCIVLGQTDTLLLSGQVSDAREEGIFAANVYCQNDPQTGTTTDFSGNFNLNITDSNDSLVISFIGYQTRKIALKDQDLSQPIHITLKEKAPSLEEVVITAQRPISEQNAVQQLNKLDIYINPLAQGDALKAVTALPASTTDDESASPSLRGSDQDRTRVALNGVPIYKPVRNSQFNGIGNFSIFNTELVDAQYVYASNPPLTYGNVSAGLIEIQTSKKLDKNQFQLSSTLASVGALASQQLGEKAFIQAFTNHQFAGPFLGLNQANLEQLKDFGSTDIGVNFHLEGNNNWSFNSFTYAIDESYDYTFQLFTYEGPSAAAKRRIFSVNNASYLFENGVFKINSGTNHSATQFSFGNLQMEYSTNQYYTSLDYQHFFGNRLKVQGGLAHDYQQYYFAGKSPQIYYAFAPENPVRKDSSFRRNANLEAYAFSTYEWKDQWLLSAGIRSNIPLSGQQQYLSGQMSIRYQPKKAHQFLLSFGQYHNYTTPGFNLMEFNLLGSRQIALDYSFARGNSQCNAAVYYKLETGDQAIDNLFLSSQTRIFGVEVFLRQSIGKYLELSLANTFLDHRLEIEDQEYPGRYDFNYFAKASIQFTPKKWPVISLSYMGRPGRYFTPVVDAYFNPDVLTFAPVFSEQLFSAQFESYHRVDLGFNKYFSFDKGSLVAFINIANLLNRSNQAEAVYSFDYSEIFFQEYTLKTVFFGVVWEN